MGNEHYKAKTGDGGTLSEQCQVMRFWSGLCGDGGHYNITRLNQHADGMEALKALFPDGKANSMNFILFSTSGVHGTYQTIEEEEIDPGTGITFVVVHPRLVALRYGNVEPQTPEDFAFLRSLRASSRKIMKAIGA